MKDDSGSYAVSSEQGSSASQMTASNAMDVNARLPGCAGQAADAVAAYVHPSKNGGRSKIVQNSQSQNVQVCGYVFHDTNGPNLGQTSKTQWFFLIEICMVPTCRSIVRKTI